MSLILTKCHNLTSIQRHHIKKDSFTGIAPTRFIFLNFARGAREEGELQEKEPATHSVK
jgi:hypothetical protein